MQVERCGKFRARYAWLCAGVIGVGGIVVGTVGMERLAVAQGQRGHVLALHRQNPPTPPSVKFDKKDFVVPPLETRVFGQRTWLRGGPASLRVIVSDHDTGKAVPAKVDLSLTPSANGKTGEPISLYSGEANAAGTLDAHFNAPKVAPGAYVLNIAVRSSLGQDTVAQPIELQEAMQLMLTSDKPIYQPGQTIHLRALALDTATREALADRAVTFEVEDARGNKVFKEKKTLSKFGVGSVDFVLADEVNMGTFTLRAIL